MKQVLVGIIMLGLLGGCQMGQGDPQENIEEEEKLDVRAVQDDYTREHLVSTNQTKDGFYTIEGELGEFQMLFPENAVLSQDMHSLEKDEAESMQFTDPAEEENRPYFVSIFYQNGISINNAERRFNSLSDSVNFKGDPEVVDYDDKRIYHGMVVHELEHSKGAPYYVYFGYVASKRHNQGLEVEYSVTCEGEDCEENLDLDREETLALRLMESVEFQQP